MANVEASGSHAGKFTDLSVSLAGVGKIKLTRLLCQNSETALYATSHHGLVVKTFDMECGKADEVSYGPYLSFCVEVENFQDILGIEELRTRVPVYYGSDIDAERKFGFIGMEYLEGDNLLAWCQAAAAAGYPSESVAQIRAALYEMLTIVKVFHQHGIILIDFKPDNVIRLFNGGVKFVDLGAFFTPRHSRETDKYVYAATPDYAELVIDTSNVQTGTALTEGSDIFAAGVGLFELATGDSRLSMAEESAKKMIDQPSLYRFRDSQIRDVWRAYPHLAELLPLVHTQLKECRILFSEFWHLLKGYLAQEVPAWDSYNETQHAQMLLEAGTTFVTEQLPEPLKWLAAPIARSTTLRSIRFKSVVELMNQIAEPVSDSVREDLARHNLVLQVARDLDPPVEFRELLNVWEVKCNPQTEHWAIAGPRAASALRAVAPFTFLKEIHRDSSGHCFFQIVGDIEADDFRDAKLTLDHLANNHSTWLGA